MSRADEIIGRLQARIDELYPSWRLNGLKPAGGGIEFLVCRARSDRFGDIALRVPWQRTIPYAVPLDSRQILLQETQLSDHLRPFGLPVPRVFATHLDDDGDDFLLCEYVEHDRSRPDSRELGMLVRAVHDSGPPHRLCVGDGDGDTRAAVARRLSMQLRRINREARLNLALPKAREIADLMKWEGERRCLLHMDARPVDNVLALDGRIAALIDWSSALTADPALELCRMDELGLLDSDFLQGYGDREWQHRLPRRVELIYRLDTAAMLAVLFACHIPDPVRARERLQRLVLLCGEFRKQIR